MAHPSILQLLERRLADDQADPEARLLSDLSDLPAEEQQNRAIQLEVMCRVATEERLNRAISRVASEITRNADIFIRRIDDDASRWAADRHLAYLTAAMRKARDSMPVNSQARKQAYFEIGLGSLAIFMLAWLALLGGQVAGVLPQPRLTAEENRQLEWAREIEKAGQKPAIEWAVEELDSEDKLIEARVSLDALKAGRSVTAEARNARSCTGSNMQLVQTPTGLICWFPFTPNR